MNASICSGIIVFARFVSNTTLLDNLEASTSDENTGMEWPAMVPDTSQATCRPIAASTT